MKTGDLANQALQAHAVCKELLVSTVPREPRVKMVMQVNVEHRDPKARRETPALKEHEVCLALQEHPDELEREVNPVCKECQDPRDLLDLKDDLVKLVEPDLKAHLENPVLTESLESKVNEEHQDHVVPRDLMVILVKLVSLV